MECRKKSLKFKRFFFVILIFLKELIISNSNTKIRYQKLCIATGALPKISFPFTKNVLTIRDTDSISTLQDNLLLKNSRILLIGNGGIATELM